MLRLATSPAAAAWARNWVNQMIAVFSSLSLARWEFRPPLSGGTEGGTRPGDGVSRPPEYQTAGANR